MAAVSAVKVALVIKAVVAPVAAVSVMVVLPFMKTEELPAVSLLVVLLALMTQRVPVVLAVQVSSFSFIGGKLYGLFNIRCNG